MGVASRANHGLPAEGHNAGLMWEQLPFASRLKLMIFRAILGGKQVDPLLKVDACLLNDVSVCLYTVEPQHVIDSGRKAATKHRICTPDPEPHDEEVVVVHAVSVSAPWRAALQPWLPPPLAGEDRRTVNSGVVEGASRDPKGKEGKGNPNLPPMARRRV